ncbi:cAMP-dependent protein kinase type II regulatory subunit-like [Tigriopus californicus]|uniref:cAMP-dependent protein kinase type II regulatory subunit-like n=1 Tax=Tigriopus californicus TaxID=6832 RepID=UPI0027DA36AE|nr:cAMP-dependent protein kinase type II regulatory subunit-like [Tigriopus californicus]
MTAGASETHNSNSSLDNSATDRYGMASVSSSNQYEIPHELQEVLLDFTVQYLIERPDDLTEFAFHYFSRLKRKKNQELDHQSDESMVSEDEQDEDQMAAYQARARRKSVFAEAYNPEEDEDDDKQVILHPKTDTQRRTLNAAVANILLFRSLDQEQKTEVIDAMFEKDVTAGENVITQGADGDNFYIIERGFFGIYVEIDGVDKQVGNYDNTGSFGELALMYNMPRAATIKAITDGVLWAMDRTTFRRIVLKSAFQKRKMYETLLESVHILKSLSSYERMNLADALVSKTFENGKTIMRQGDNADGMYFVEDGEVIVRMTGEDDLDREIKVISKGGYFGELGLLNQQLRAASILAKGKVKVAFLDKQAFERLLGPCMDVMKERTEDYQEELEKIFQSTAAISNTH